MPRDAVDIMEENGIVISWLAGRTISAAGTTRDFLFTELTKVLYAHLTATTILVEPTLDKHLPFHEALDIYADVGVRLAELVTDTRGGPTFEQRLRGLAARVSELRKREAELTLPALEHYLSKDERAMLGAELELAMDRLAGKSAVALRQGNSLLGPHRTGKSPDSF